MKKIALTQGKFALVDDEDFEKLSKFKWIYKKNRSKGNYNEYVYRHTSRNNYIRKQIYLHHEIMGHGIIDHINGDGLDNRKENLRFSSKSQNQWNKRTVNKIGFKGVKEDYRSKTPLFYANISANKKRYYLGSFRTPEEAHEAYKKAAIALHGEFAKW
jgi:hypothetical protein